MAGMFEHSWLLGPVLAHLGPVLAHLGCCKACEGGLVISGHCGKLLFHPDSTSKAPKKRAPKEDKWSASDPDLDPRFGTWKCKIKCQIIVPNLEAVFEA